MSVERFTGRHEEIANKYSREMSGKWYCASHPHEVGAERSMKAREFLSFTKSNFRMFVNNDMDDVPQKTYEEVFTGLHHMIGDIVPPPENIRDN